MINRGDALVGLAHDGDLPRITRLVELYGADVNHVHSKDVVSVLLTAPGPCSDAPVVDDHVVVFSMLVMMRTSNKAGLRCMRQRKWVGWM